MRVVFVEPSVVEGELLETNTPGEIETVRPKRWSTKQQVLTVAPILAVTEGGEILDRVVLTVNQKTGKLALSRVAADVIDCEADSGAKKCLK